MNIIRWIRGRMYHGKMNARVVGHLFKCGDNEIMLKNFGVGEYPPFDCLVLTNDDAIQLREWLNEVIT